MGRKLLAILGSAVLAGTMLAGTARAVTMPPPYGHVLLTIHQGETTSGPLLAEAELWCNSDGGTHPDPAAACAALGAAGGDPANIPPTPGFCTMQYDPVTAVAQGYWQGGVQTISFQQTYGNACVLHHAKTPLFDIF